MSLEEIYSHLAVPEDDTFSKSIFTTTYDSSTKRIKKQKKITKKGFWVD